MATGTTVVVSLTEPPLRVVLETEGETMVTNELGSGELVRLGTVTMAVVLAPLMVESSDAVTGDTSKEEMMVVPLLMIVTNEYDGLGAGVVNAGAEVVTVSDGIDNVSTEAVVVSTGPTGLTPDELAGGEAVMGLAAELPGVIVMKSVTVTVAVLPDAAGVTGVELTKVSVVPEPRGMLTTVVLAEPDPLLTVLLPPKVTGETSKDEMNVEPPLVMVMVE